MLKTPSSLELFKAVKAIDACDVRLTRVSEDLRQAATRYGHLSKQFEPILACVDSHVGHDGLEEQTNSRACIGEHDRPAGDLSNPQGRGDAGYACCEMCARHAP